MIKLLGCILILCASICACVFYEKKEKAKLISVKEIISFVEHIRSQIEYFSYPLDKIFSSYEEHSFVTTSISKNEVDSIKEYLDKEDFNLISSLFSSLGKGLKKDQLSLCSYSVERLRDSYRKKEEDFPKKIKVFRAMALFCGFCAIILLI